MVSDQSATDAPQALTSPPTPERTLFGHPVGLAYILGAEAGWAFAYFGMQMMLTLYMTQTLLKPGHVEHVLGFSAYRAMLGGLYGPLSPMGVASQTFGLATGLIYALPILGGLIGDRWLGQRRTVLAGVLVLTFAHVLLIGEQTFLIALALMVVGSGLVKTNLVGQLGRLYAPDDDRRSRAFGLYLIALNVGSLSTPLISGTLGERLGWRYGFIALAVGMGLGALSYIAGRRHMPADAIAVRSSGAPASPRLKRGDGPVVAVLLLMMILDGINLGTYNQAFNVFPVWAEAHVERHVLGFLAPVTWFSTLDGVFTILGTILAVRIWAWQAGRTAHPNNLARVGLGFGLAAAAFGLLAASALIGGMGKAPLAPEIGFFLLIDFSIPWIDTVILTLISSRAPVAILSTLLGLYYLALAGGNFLTGWLGALADRMSMPAFWLMHAGIFGGVLVFLLLAGPRLHRLLAPGAATA